MRQSTNASIVGRYQREQNKLAARFKMFQIALNSKNGKITDVLDEVQRQSLPEVIKMQEKTNNN